MRWVNSGTAAAALALLAGCGNYSTEDLRFLVALPTRDDLRVTPPATASAAGAVLDPAGCTSGTADVWLSAKPTSDGLNAGVDFVVSLVDVVRRVPPTAREENARRWGPFPDEHHPGREIQIVMVRSFPYGTEERPAHEYRFEARVAGDPAGFDPVIVGSFDGASARRGSGRVVLDFDNMWKVGINDLTTPRGRMEILYDRMSDPVTIDLGFSTGGFGVEQFGYGYAGFRDGSGRFDFRIRNPNDDVLTITTAYDRAGAGRAAVTYTRSPASGGGSGSFSQCWGPAACLTYVRDPANFTCGTPPCSFGTYPDHCVPVPYVGPFPVP